MKLNLRNKFLVPTLFLVFFGMAILTLISYINSKSALEHAIKGQMTGVTDGIQDQLETWVNRVKDNIKLWAELDQFQAELAQQNTLVGKWTNIGQYNAQLLMKTKEDGYYYDFIGLANRRGEVHVTSDTDKVTKPIIVKDKAFFQTAIKGPLFISDIFKNSRTSKPAFIVSAPVYGIDEYGTESTDEINGVIYAIVNMEYFNNAYIDKVDVGKTGYAFIYNKNGIAVAHSDASEIMNLDLKKYDFGREMLKLKKGVTTYNLEGIENIASFDSLPKTGWGVAVGVGASEVFAPVKNIGLISILILLIVVSLFSLIMWLMTGMLILKPISKVITGLKDLAEGEGDLTTRLQVNSDDEVGELSRWFNTFMERLQRIISEIGVNADSLTASSVELSELSGSMSAGADSMSTKSNTVNHAADEMSSNINTVATAMEQASTNMNLVASAAEEMTATINEIAQNSEKARSITNDAVSQSDDASKKIDELGKAAQEIGKVTEAITDISEQTNLLALNATIEAARAGEAGKGFAVVANEIKELAKQTAEATQDIKTRINGIQISTSESVTQVEEISRVIKGVNEFVSTIAAAVEEQSVSTKEIAGNVAQASSGIQEVSEKVTDSSTVADKIAKDIGDVNQSSTDMSNSSSQVDLSAHELADLASKLKEQVEKFKVSHDV